MREEVRETIMAIGLLLMGFGYGALSVLVLYRLRS